MAWQGLFGKVGLLNTGNVLFIFQVDSVFDTLLSIKEDYSLGDL
jgi:hypothetical protein